MAIRPTTFAFLLLPPSMHDQFKDRERERRQYLMLAASLASVTLCELTWGKPVSGFGGNAARSELAAAWEDTKGHRVGILEQRDSALEIRTARSVPTRAHGFLSEPGGTVLSVARRPGDWLLRWNPSGSAVSWCWIEPDRAFNGHVVASVDQKTLYTTETNLETGQGLIGLRDLATLEKLGEWSTHGMDPHQLLLDEDGSLMIANGGIPVQPETGRAKLQLDTMDSSLVRLDMRSGALLGQWRLADRRLSIRHLVWGPLISQNRLLGVALQAEHDNAAAKISAPVLAIFDGQQLISYPAGQSQQLKGYGGDITCVADRFMVSCPRAQGVAVWRSDGRWQGFIALEEACALSAIPSPNIQTDNKMWAGGRHASFSQRNNEPPTTESIPAVRLDNHWISLPPIQRSLHRLLSG